MFNNSLINNYDIDDYISQKDENFFNYDYSIKGIDELSISNEYILFDNTNFTSLDMFPPVNSECHQI